MRRALLSLPILIITTLVMILTSCSASSQAAPTAVANGRVCPKGAGFCASFPGGRHNQIHKEGSTYYAEVRRPGSLERYSVRVLELPAHLDAVPHPNDAWICGLDQIPAAPHATVCKLTSHNPSLVMYNMYLTSVATGDKNYVVSASSTSGSNPSLLYKFFGGFEPKKS